MKQILSLKRVLELKGIKQRWLADELGVTEVTISNWVNNRTYPSLETLNSISQILNIEIKELLEPNKLTNGE
jgi:putative transcriptional regulator